MEGSSKQTFQESDWRLSQQTIPFSAPKTFAGPYEKTTLHQRSVLLLSCETQAKPLAELAVLPGFQRASLKEVQELAIEHILKKSHPSHWKQWTDDEYLEFKHMALNEAEKAGLTPESQASLSSFMEQLRGFFVSPRQNLEKPKMSSLTTASEFPNGIQASGTVKIKVQNHELEKLFHDMEKRVRQSPLLIYRLDGNRQLKKSHLLELFQKASPTVRNSIQYIEEPCSDFRDHLELIDQLPLALDESLRDFQYQQDGKDETQLKRVIKKAPYFICKPLLHGGPNSTRDIYQKVKTLQQTAQEGQGKKIQFIVSHCFEGPIGLEWNKRLAMEFDPKCKYHHGINWKP